MPLPGLSVEPPAVITSFAAVDQVAEPPLTLVGSVGGLRSSLTVLAAVALAGAQAVALPALSSARNCTSVCPSAVIVSELPEDGLLQLTPALVDVRYW